MNDLPYNGKGKLGEVLAVMYGFSAKNQKAVRNHIKKAKDKLGIFRPGKLTIQENLAVYLWHGAQMKIKQPGAVEIDSQCSNTAIIRIAFYIQHQRVKVQRVIALDAFYINALMLATGINKNDVPKWVQSEINSWAEFNSELSITKQVKFLLIRELTNHFK